MLSIKNGTQSAGARQAVRETASKSRICQKSPNEKPKQKTVPEADEELVCIIQFYCKEASVDVDN